MSSSRDNGREHTSGQAPTDLSHLHPDRLRLGSIGVFAGDWAWTGNPPRIPVGFVGTLIDHWNGWAVFRCTREVAEAIVADQNRMREAERARLAAAGITGRELQQRVDEAVAPMCFDGDDLVCDETAIHGDGAADRHSPGEDGRYCVQGFNWCWIAVDPAVCDQIAGVLPELGRHREFVYATHEPLRMPHDRLTVASINYLQTHRGVAYTAVLHLDGQLVGTIENTGCGGMTTFEPATATFGLPQLIEFAAACRWRGQPVPEDQVLEALITEYETNLQITDAEAAGRALIMLRDGDGHVVATDYSLDRNQPHKPNLRDLARQLTESEAAKYPYLTQLVWEIWTGTRWQLMDIVDLPRSPAGER